MHGPSAQMVKEVLVAYSQGRATRDAVMRSLVGYRGWLVPALWMISWRPGSDTLIIYGDTTRLPPGEVWVFTDHDAASLAANAGAQLGAYAADIPGTEIFRRLDQKWTVRVNPGSPAEEAWFISRDASALASNWCDAVELEEALAQIPHPDPEALMKLVLAYKWFVVLLRKSDHGVVTFTDESRTEVAPLFTTNDNCTNFLDKFSPAEQEQVHSACVVGARVFEAVRENKLIGKVVINAFGPAPSRVFYLG
jgi:hypothetical protein